MGVKIGNNNIKGMFLGTNGVSKAFLGSVQVWPTSIGSRVFYTSTNGKEIYSTSPWGDAKIISNTYDGGIGCIEFDTILTTIPYGCMAWDNLETITLPEGVTTIERGAFWQQLYLNSIVLPSTLEYIRDWAFYYISYTGPCEIWSYAKKAPSIFSNTFDGIAEVGVLHYPAGSDYSYWIANLPEGWTCLADL